MEPKHNAFEFPTTTTYTIISYGRLVDCGLICGCRLNHLAGFLLLQDIGNLPRHKALPRSGKPDHVLVT